MRRSSPEPSRLAEPARPLLCPDEVLIRDVLDSRGRSDASCPPVSGGGETGSCPPLSGLSCSILPPCQVTAPVCRCVGRLLVGRGPVWVLPGSGRRNDYAEPGDLSGGVCTRSDRGAPCPRVRPVRRAVIRQGVRRARKSGQRLRERRCERVEGARHPKRQAARAAVTVWRVTRCAQSSASRVRRAGL